MVSCWVNLNCNFDNLCFKRFDCFFSSKLLKNLDVDYVHVLVDGKIVLSGDASLADRIDKEGYKEAGKIAKDIELTLDSIDDIGEYFKIKDINKKVYFHVTLTPYRKDIEPNYLNIEDGQWIGDSNYGVVHRIASDGSEKGIGSFCIKWAFEQCGHLRIDTHADNTVMQNLLRKLGFVHCGTIYVREDRDPRLAFEKTACQS